MTPEAERSLKQVDLVINQEKVGNKVPSGAVRSVECAVWEKMMAPRIMDLGRVGDVAEVSLSGRSAARGSCLIDACVPEELDVVHRFDRFPAPIATAEEQDRGQ